MSAVSRLTSAVGAAVVALAVVVQTTTDNADLADTCYLGVLVGAGTAAWIGVRRWPRERRLMPRLVAAGVSLNAAGEVLWTILYRAGVDHDVSVADVSWFTSYVFLCAALWVVLSRSRKDGRVDLGFVVDAVTIIVVTVLAFWRLTVDAIVTDHTVSPFVRAVWASYPVLDAILLALVIRVLLSRSARAAIDSWFAVGVCLWLTADILYLLQPEQPTAMVIQNAGWMLGPVLMARAAWRVRGAGVDVVRTPTTHTGWVIQLLVAVCPLVVPPTLELVADLRDQPDKPLQLFAGTAAVMALAFVRTGLLIQSEQRAQRELEVARDAALAASDAKSMFLANMSHEIRTPLTAVLVAGGLLKTTPLDRTQLELLGRMHRSGERLMTLVEGLLDFSRIEAGRTVIERSEFDLRALVTDIVDAHLPRARRKGVRFDWEMDSRVPQRVVGDRTRVFQVLNNLVENALKFTAEGSVRLSIGPDDRPDGQAGAVQFCVSDTGIGIPEDEQASVFESFSQVDGSATRHYEGTGLGLAISKELTELMGGAISVSSELGEGSTFTVRLPLAAAEPAPVTRSEPLHTARTRSA